MQTYIINPMWFYWINVSGELCAFASITAVIGIIALIVLGTWLSIVFFVDREDETIPGLAKAVKWIVLFMACSAMLSILIPSKETLISMMVAKFATYDNAQWTADAIKSTVDYIIEAFKTIG